MRTYEMPQFTVSRLRRCLRRVRELDDLSSRVDLGVSISGGTFFNIASPPPPSSSAIMMHGSTCAHTIRQLWGTQVLNTERYTSKETH